MDVHSKKKVFFIPPSTSGEPDHAYFWGKAFSEVFESSLVINAFVKSDDSMSQKSLSKSQRHRMNYEAPYLTEIQKNFAGPNYEFIFCDDIYTTGSTAMAAYRALGEPENYKVWVLARRIELKSQNLNRRRGLSLL